MQIKDMLFGDLYIGRSSTNSKRKIGVSSNTVLRWKYIDKSMRGRQDFIFRFPVLFPYFFEEVFQSLFEYWRAPLKRGSGKTEWYKGGYLMELVMILYILLIHFSEWAFFIFLVFYLT